jgi:hypothetical protein
LYSNPPRVRALIVREFTYLPKIFSTFFCFCRDTPQWSRAFSFTRCLDHTKLRTSVGRTPLEERSACRRDLYLTTHDTHNRQTSMPPVGFDPTVSGADQPLSHVSDRAATGTGLFSIYEIKFILSKFVYSSLRPKKPVKNSGVSRTKERKKNRAKNTSNKNAL